MPVAGFAELVSDLQTYLARRDHRHRRSSESHAVARPRPTAEGPARHRRVRPAHARPLRPRRGAGDARRRRGSRIAVAWALDVTRKAAVDAGRELADVSFGAYVNVGCHPDLDVARSLISGSVAAFAHFSSMPGSTGAGTGRGRSRGRRRSRSPLRQQRAPPQQRRAHRSARTGVRRSLRDRRAARRVRRPAPRARRRSASHGSSSPVPASAPTGTTLVPRTSCSRTSCCPNCTRGRRHDARSDHPRRHGHRRHRRRRAHGRHRDRRRRRHRPSARSTAKRRNASSTPTGCSSRPASSTSTATTTARRRGTRA